jgi:broad specificity phosphatase PhoE
MSTNDPRPASITLVRHGESVANTFNLKNSVDDVPEQWRGTPDHKIPLTERGRQQARDTGKALAEVQPEGFDFIYFSPFHRTRQTAEEIVSGFPEAVAMRMRDRFWPDLFLREQAFGYADLIAAPTAIGDRFEDAYRRFEHHRSLGGKFFTRPDNGESWCDVCERTHTFMGKLFQEPRRGAHVLVVSHGVTIATFRYHLERLSEDEVVDAYHQSRVSNCGVARYEHRRGERSNWTLAYWNRVFYSGPATTHSNT